MKSLRSYVIVAPWSPDYGGGVNEVVLNLYREIGRAGQLTPLIMLSERSPFRPVERLVDGRRTVYLRLISPWSSARPLTRLVKWFLTAPLALVTLLWFCRKHRVAAFNFHYPSLDAFPIALLRRAGLFHGALILSFHGSDLQELLGAGRLERWFWRFLLRQASAVVACSQALAAEVRRFAGKIPAQVHAIHNGVDIGNLMREVDRSASPPAALLEREFILSIATFERKKGLDVLLRAFARVRRTHPRLRLVLVGRSGPEENRLRVLAVELGIEDDVLFYSDVPHSQVGLFLEHAKVFALPSRAEPFGIVVLEAGAYRVPVVASKVGGIPEIVVDGESGVLVEPENPEALAGALERVLADDAWARGLGERLHRRVATGFSWDRAHQAYQALLA
jgi:glycosyltransferase involved in cell wall biosynthesis